MSSANGPNAGPGGQGQGHGQEGEWTKQFSKTHKRDYWFNTITGKSVWEDPVTDAGTSIAPVVSAPVAGASSVFQRVREEANVDGSATHGKWIAQGNTGSNQGKCPALLIQAYGPKAYDLNNKSRRTCPCVCVCVVESRGRLACDF
jgi:hypothetical protein